jgi:hypothetical protein
LGQGVEVEEAVTSPGKLLSCSEIRKMKDEETGLLLASKLEIVTIGFDGDGDPINSLVAFPSETIRSVAPKAKLTGNNKIVSDALMRALNKVGAIPTPGPDVPDHTPTISIDIWRSCACDKLPQEEIKRKNEAFNRSATWLMNNGYVGKWRDSVWSMSEPRYAGRTGRTGSHRDLTRPTLIGAE